MPLLVVDSFDELIRTTRETFRTVANSQRQSPTGQCREYGGVLEDEGTDRHLRSVIHARVQADTVPHPRLASSFCLSPSLFFYFSHLILLCHSPSCPPLLLQLQFSYRDDSLLPFFCLLAVAEEKNTVVVYPCIYGAALSTRP